MEVEWFELLPEQCPPEDAQQCDGYYYRIANGNPVQSVDFFSQRRLQPDKVFKGLGVDECITRAVSLFSDSKDGMIKKTFGTAHYSWWRTKDFDVSQAKVI